MIWIVTDTLARAIYMIAYVPVLVITALWCLWRSLIVNIKSAMKTPD